MEIITDSIWKSYPNLLHGFATRRGGVSQSPYDEFNWSLSVGDDQRTVEVNREQFSEQFDIPLAHCLTLRQVHGKDILEIDFKGALPDSTELQKGYDALMTSRTGILLGIQTADCLPVLIFDVKKNIVAAVHAGWKGTYLGITMKVIQAMTQRYQSSSQDIQALLGPSVGRCCYEFGVDEIKKFQKRYPHHANWIEIRNGSFFLDVREANRFQLMSVGVPAEQIRSVTACTCCERERFFSVRRDEITGRHLNFIMLRPDANSEEDNR